MLRPEAPRSEDAFELSRWRDLLTRYIEQAGNEEVNAVQTTDATETTLWFRTLADESAYWFEARVVGKEDGSGNRAAYIRRVLVFRNGGGATIQGAVSATETIESDAAWDCDFDVSGNDVRLRITGVAATVIDWKSITSALVIR